MYKVPEEWKLSDFLELSNDEKLKWLYNGVKNAGGGSDLPNVTSDDNGDVLTVVDGAWAKATPSGGGLFEIETVYDETEGTYTMNKTATEILTAFRTGQRVLIHMAFDTDQGGGLSAVANQYIQMVGYQEDYDNQLGQIYQYELMFFAMYPPDTFNTYTIYVFYCEHAADHPTFSF